MIVLKLLNVEKDAILNDYSLSDSVYKDLNDSDAMVVAMKQVMDCFI